MAKAAKRDRRGETRWRQILRQQARSGLSIRAFCRWIGVGEATFYAWRRRLAPRQQNGTPDSSPSFVPVIVTPQPDPPAAGAMEILSPDGWRIRVAGPTDRAALIDVLAALIAACGAEDQEDRPC